MRHRINLGKLDMFPFLQLTFQSLRWPTRALSTNKERRAMHIRDKNGEYFWCEFSMGSSLLWTTNSSCFTHQALRLLVVSCLWCLEI